ncbi:MAG: phosphoenolpyruvate carboxykinase (ATP), partial [Promethearchaeota archaeon]
MPVRIEDDLSFDDKDVIRNPDDAWFAEYLKPYYVKTADGQYLFGNTQAGRRPDRAFYIIPDGYKLGKGQRSFDREIGLKLYDVVLRYLKTAKVIVADGIQGEADYKTGLRIILSVENPHTAYITWFGRLMVYPPEEDMDIHCWNYIVQERLPETVIQEIQSFWADFDPDEPLTLYDLTRMDQDHRRVMSLRVDYFGGAFKKPNLTMVWNRGEADGLISYHAGCTKTRVLKGLSGTGKTTLTVGPLLEQDDAVLGLLEYSNTNRHIDKVHLIGLEAASYAKSEGLEPSSPEWAGLMKSRDVQPDGSHPVVLAQNIDCEGIEYRMEKIAGHTVKVPRLLPGEQIGHLQPTRYEKSGTTNGRFVFRFYDLNPNWTPGSPKQLRTVMLSFRRFDIFPLVSCI